MADFAIDVEVRSDTGKGVARKLRAAGRIPGVYYGRGVASVPISLDPRALEHILATSAAGMNTLIDIAAKGVGEVDGKTVLVKELQRDPVWGEPLHADLYAIDLARAIQVSVPIHLIGTAKGVQMGGIVDHALRELEIECLANAIPEEFPIDVGDLDVGESLHVRDIALPEGVTLISDAELSVVSVVAPVAEEEPKPEEELAEGEEAAPAEGDEAPAEDAGKADTDDKAAGSGSE